MGFCSFIMPPLRRATIQANGRRSQKGTEMTPNPLVKIASLLLLVVLTLQLSNVAHASYTVLRTNQPDGTS
ncbi:MAG: hypothetical protein ABIO92_06645, partial [Chloroflexia bacterium]